MVLMIYYIMYMYYADTLLMTLCLDWLHPRAMSDASLVNFLQSELLLLSNEIKKKYPEIKEVKIV